MISGGESDHEVMKVRVELSRTLRDLLISSGKGSVQRLHRTFRRLRRKHNEQIDRTAGEEFTIAPGPILDFCSLHLRPIEELVPNIVLDALVLDGVIEKCETLADPFESQLTHHDAPEVHLESNLENHETFAGLLQSNINTKHKHTTKMTNQPRTQTRDQANTHRHTNDTRTTQTSHTHKTTHTKPHTQTTHANDKHTDTPTQHDTQMPTTPHSQTRTQTLSQTHARLETQTHIVSLRASTKVSFEFAMFKHCSHLWDPA